MTNLSEVLAYVATCSEQDRAKVFNALSVAYHGMLPPSPYDPPYTTENSVPAVEHSIPTTRVAKAAATLSKIGEGDTVTFPYDGVIYTARVNKINKMTAIVAVTAISGTPVHSRNRGISVGQVIKVGASILARSI